VAGGAALALTLAGALSVHQQPRPATTSAPQSPQQTPLARPAGGLVDPAPLTREDISPGFLGLYRKVMEIEDRIRTQAAAYGLDYDLARAVCLYESGGNAGLTSWAGAEGYFQVMPATQRTLGVNDNIEAGIKYLSQLVDRFDREDYALAAYNGGPATVGRNRPMRLESLQYVIGVGHYRMMLKLYEEPIRRYAGELQLDVARQGDTWWTVSQRLGIPLLQLRLYNPYIGIREMRPGMLIAHPDGPRDDLYRIEDDAIYYRSRLGDNYFGIGFAFDVKLDALRDENKLWHLQTLPPGMELRLPLFWVPPEPDEDDEPEEEPEVVQHTVATGETIASIRAQYDTSEWRILRDNFLWDEQLPPAGTVLDITIDPVEPEFTAHTVRRGENLTIIAHRYGTSVSAIQEANNMGSRTVIRVGQQLLVPRSRQP
jgi:LysM repeat protein